MENRDLELVRRCVAGEAAAWRELVRTHVDLLHRTVSRIAPAGEVEDVLQTAFTRLVEGGCWRLRSFEGKSRLSTWLVAVTRRVAIEHLRRKGRIAPMPASEATSAPPEALLEIAETREGLERALQNLPERDRLLLRLVYWDECSYEEAARLLRVPVNSVSTWIVRAKERLRVHVTE